MTWTRQRGSPVLHSLQRPQSISCSVSGMRITCGIQVGSLAWRRSHSVQFKCSCTQPGQVNEAMSGPAVRSNHRSPRSSSRDALITSSQSIRHAEIASRCEAFGAASSSPNGVCPQRSRQAAARHEPASSYPKRSTRRGGTAQCSYGRLPTSALSVSRTSIGDVSASARAVCASASNGIRRSPSRSRMFESVYWNPIAASMDGWIVASYSCVNSSTVENAERRRSSGNGSCRPRGCGPAGVSVR